MFCGVMRIVVHIVVGYTPENPLAKIIIQTERLSQKHLWNNIDY